MERLATDIRGMHALPLCADRSGVLRVQSGSNVDSDIEFITEAYDSNSAWGGRLRVTSSETGFIQARGNVMNGSCPTNCWIGRANNIFCPTTVSDSHEYH